MDDWKRVLGDAKLSAESTRFRDLMDKALARFPKGEPTIRSVTEVRLRKMSRTSGLVGLTTYSDVDHAGQEAKRGRATCSKQRITFYAGLLDRLSGPAAIGVIAHELAHASLNERVKAQASKKREREADELARRWGYGRYLDALKAETF